MKILSAQLARNTAARLSRAGGVVNVVQVSRPLVVGGGPTLAQLRLKLHQEQQQSGKAFFSSSSADTPSHDDFAPRKKAISGEEEALELIKQHVQENRIMLYMKGNPSMPMCGFSAKVVKTLQTEGIDFASVNVLDYPAIREGIKKYSDWPTIPQLYVDGEFVGGCDIVTSMHESGELKELLQLKKEE